MDDGRIRLLYVEDDLIDQMAFKRMVATNHYPYDYVFSSSIGAGIQALKSQPFDIVITDYNLGDGTAFDLFDAIGDIPLIIATGAGDEEIAVKAIKSRAYDYLIKDANRNYLTMLPVAVDQAITRYRSEQQFRMLSQALMNINDMVCILNPEHHFVFVNRAFLQTYGYTEEEIIGRHAADLAYSSTESEITEEIFEATLAGGWQGELTTRRKDGSIFPVFLSTSAIKDNHNRPAFYIGVSNDITLRRKEAMEFHMEKERLSATLGSIDVAVITTDANGRIILFNRAAEEITGWRFDEAVTKPCREVFVKPAKGSSDDMQRNPVKYVLDSGRSYRSSSHSQLVTREGSIKLIIQNATPLKSGKDDTIGVVLTFRDVTLQLKMEEEIRKSQRLESLGVLAGGIAHDFNNILTAIIGNISMARMFSSSADNLERFLGHALNAAEQTRSLTNQLLTFARGGNPIKENASIVDLIRETTSFVVRGSGVKCDYFFADNIWVLEMDIGQINQVINNLVINAIQAMPDGGAIRIYVKNVSFQKEHPDRPGILEPGDYVSIAIQDQGCGIPEEILPNIFDPYFTTKDSGNGLGLASCYSIIRKHDGHIQVESREGVGTTFTILLPAAPEEQVVAHTEEETLYKGDARILFMDDENYIRDIAGEMLKYLGFEVAFSSDGREAIKLYREAQENGTSYDLVMLDITIPGGMGGKETIKHLRDLNPNLKAIVASGYSKDPVMEKFREFGFNARLLKPFGLKELSKVLHELN